VLDPHILRMRGQAEPPITSRRTVARRVCVACRWRSRPSHTVGTPAATVTRSVFISSVRLAPSRCRPGMINAVPDIGAA
jgi:hypothetical protein